jgi:type IV secretion system protein VirB9
MNALFRALPLAALALLGPAAGAQSPNIAAAPSTAQPAPPAYTALDGDDRVFVDYGPNAEAIQYLVDEYRRTGRAEVFRQSDVVIYPHGHGQPVVTTAPLRASIIELQPNETVIGLISGDMERFMVETTYMGPGGRTPVVVVKPMATDITTNLIITTDRRAYHLTLDAQPETRGSSLNPQARYARHVRFYYPDEQVREMVSQERLQALEAAERAAVERRTVRLTDGVGLDDLNFDYVVDADEDFPWEPATIYDDGVHTYIKLPPAARTDGDLPVLFDLSKQGDLEVINYAFRNGFYITDRVVRHAAFVIGVDKRGGLFGLGRKKREEVRMTIHRPSAG